MCPDISSHPGLQFCSLGCLILLQPVEINRTPFPWQDLNTSVYFLSLCLIRRETQAFMNQCRENSCAIQMGLSYPISLRLVCLLTTDAWEKPCPALETSSDQQGWLTHPKHNCSHCFKSLTLWSWFFYRVVLWPQTTDTGWYQIICTLRNAQGKITPGNELWGSWFSEDQNPTRYC